VSVVEIPKTYTAIASARYQSAKTKTALVNLKLTV